MPSRCCSGHACSAVPDEALRTVDTAPAIVGLSYPIDPALTWTVGAGMAFTAALLLLLWNRLAPGVDAVATEAEAEAV